MQRIFHSNLNYALLWLCDGRCEGSNKLLTGVHCELYPEAHFGIAVTKKCKQIGYICNNRQNYYKVSFGVGIGL